MVTANFNLGTQGASVLTTDPGDDTQFDTAQIGATCTLAYDATNAASGKACKHQTAGAGVDAYYSWDTVKFGTQTDHYGRLYLFQQALPGTLYGLVQFNSGASLSSRIYINTNGQIIVGDQSGGGVGTMTTPTPAGQLMRIEWHLIHSVTVGQIEVKLFTRPFDTNPTDTLTTAANKNILASCNRIFIGLISSGTTGPIWTDAAVAAAAAYPGSIPVRSQPGVLAAAGGLLG